MITNQITAIMKVTGQFVRPKFTKLLQEIGRLFLYLKSDSILVYPDKENWSKVYINGLTHIMPTKDVQTFLAAEGIKMKKKTNMAKCKGKRKK